MPSGNVSVAEETASIISSSFLHLPRAWAQAQATFSSFSKFTCGDICAGFVLGFVERLREDASVACESAGEGLIESSTLLLCQDGDLCWLFGAKGRRRRGVKGAGRRPWSVTDLLSDARPPLVLMRVSGLHGLNADISRQDRTGVAGCSCDDWISVFLDEAVQRVNGRDMVTTLGRPTP